MFGERLKQLRADKKLTQQELANILKISRGTYAHYEIGKREPDQKTLILFAEFFNVSTDDLLGRKVQPATQQISQEDQDLLDKIKNLSPEKRKAIEILSGADELAAVTSK